MFSEIFILFDLPHSKYMTSYPRMIPFGSRGGSQVNVNDADVVLSILTFRGGPLGTGNNRITKRTQVR